MNMTQKETENISFVVKIIYVENANTRSQSRSRATEEKMPKYKCVGCKQLKFQ